MIFQLKIKLNQYHTGKRHYEFLARFKWTRAERMEAATIESLKKETKGINKFDGGVIDTLAVGVPGEGHDNPNHEGEAGTQAGSFVEVEFGTNMPTRHI